jgi:hypothetical protein
MFPRVEWLKLQVRHGRSARLPFALFYFITFEAYYRLCAILGYRPRHFLAPLPEGLRGVRAGEHVLVIRPRLPLSIRLLDRIFYRIGHAEMVPYTAEAAASAAASGRHTEVLDVVEGELHAGGGFK